jgi:hypothetical protein
MPKSISSISLVIPLAAVMSAPAEANNKMICVVQAAAPQAPQTDPVPIPATTPGTFFCPNLIVNWTQGKCEKSNTPENFCVLVPLKGVFSQRFRYKAVDIGSGKIECQRDGNNSENAYARASGWSTFCVQKRNIGVRS